MVRCEQLLLTRASLTGCIVCCQPQEFHRTAQQCSARVTVHFMHTMNWVKEVKGACWVDWTLTRLAAQGDGEWQAAAVFEQVRVGFDSHSFFNSKLLCLWLAWEHGR